MSKGNAVFNGLKHIVLFCFSIVFVIAFVAWVVMRQPPEWLETAFIVSGVPVLLYKITFYLSGGLTETETHQRRGPKKGKTLGKAATDSGRSKRTQSPGSFSMLGEFETLLGTAPRHAPALLALTCAIAFTLGLMYVLAVFAVSLALTGPLATYAIEPVRTSAAVQTFTDSVIELSDELKKPVADRPRMFSRRKLATVVDVVAFPRNPIPEFILTLGIAAALAIPMAPVFTVPSRFARRQLGKRTRERDQSNDLYNRPWTQAILLEQDSTDQSSLEHDARDENGQRKASN